MYQNRIDQVDLSSISTRTPAHRKFAADWLGLTDPDAAWGRLHLSEWAVKYLQARAVTPKSALERGLRMAKSSGELPEALPANEDYATGGYLAKGSWTKWQRDHLDKPGVEALVTPWYCGGDSEALTFELRWSEPRQAPDKVNPNTGKVLTTRAVKVEFPRGIADGHQPGDVPIDNLARLAMPFNHDLAHESGIYDGEEIHGREIPTLLTEGVFKGDAMSGQIALEGWAASVHSMRGVWQGLLGADRRETAAPAATSVLLPVLAEPGAAFLIYDPDWRHNPAVRQALITTAEVIQRDSLNPDRRVYVVDVPETPAGNGVDDWLAYMRLTNPDGDHMLDLLENYSLDWREAERQTRIYEQTDMGRATRVADECVAQGHRYHPGLGWLAYKNGLHMADADAEIMELAKRLVFRIVDPGGKQETVKARLAAQSAAALNNAVNGAQTPEGVRVKPTDLDANPSLLNCVNGVVVLGTGELLPHSPDYLMTSMTSCVYNPKAWAESLHWRVFLRETLVHRDGTYDPELAEQVQILAGSWLYGENHEKFAVLLGEGGNGKSVLMNTIAEALEEYASSLDPDVLTGGGNQFSEADVFGRRVVFASETAKGQALNEAVMKRLSSTKDKIRVEHKGKKAFYARPTHSLVLATNNAPYIRSMDTGVRRRMLFIPFYAVVPEELQNGKIFELLATEHEAVLAWLIEGAVKFAQRGKTFLISEASKKANDDYFKSNDPLNDFIEDYLEVTGAESDRLGRGDLYEAYTHHCAANRRHAVLGQRKFYAALRDRKFAETTSSGRRYFVGVRASDDAPHVIQSSTVSY